MTNPTPVASPCQGKEAPPLQQGTILDCPDCGCRWRHHERGLVAAREELKFLGAVVDKDERAKMLQACRVPRCPGCSHVTGAVPATDQSPPELSLGEVYDLLEASGFAKQEDTSLPASITVDATYPFREIWWFKNAVDKATDTSIPHGEIDVSPDKLPEQPRIAQPPRRVVVMFRALSMDIAEPRRSLVAWLQVTRYPFDSDPRIWCLDRASLEANLAQMLSWAAGQ